MFNGDVVGPHFQVVPQAVNEKDFLFPLVVRVALDGVGVLVPVRSEFPPHPLMSLALDRLEGLPSGELGVQGLKPTL